MSQEATQDQQIQAEVEHLRARFPQTQDLYRETCVLLFFRFGITPTANRLYQFVRKGSMSAPAEALAKFWVDLREKSRVRIEHPDLPAELRDAAGELVAGLWTKAQAAAQESLATQRSDADARVATAEAAREQALAERDRRQREADAVRAELAQASDRVRALEQQLAAAVAARTLLEAQLQQAGQDAARLASALESARREFSAELDKLRAAAELGEERLRAAEERALREIDRERNQTARLQKELDQARAASAQGEERRRSEAAGLQAEIGDLRSRSGHLEGRLQAAIASRDSAAEELSRLRPQLTDATAQAAAARAESDNWRQRAEAAEAATAELRDRLLNSASRARPRIPPAKAGQRAK